MRNKKSGIELPCTLYWPVHALITDYQPLVGGRRYAGCVTIFLQDDSDPAPVLETDWHDSRDAAESQLREMIAQKVQEIKVRL